MEAIYYLCMLIGIGWLLVWSVMPEGRARNTWWWPFDMTDDAPAETPAETPPRRGAPRTAATPRRQGMTAQSKAPWRGRS